MSNYLITGASGYIGSHTVIELIQHTGFDIIGIDNQSNSSLQTYEYIEKITKKSIQHIEIDLCDLAATEKVFQTHKISGIIHFAAFKAVGESVEKPLKYYHNNLTSLMNLLHLCEKFRVSNFIFSSSCSVYGNVKELPVNEETELQKAESPYAYTKQIGEVMIQDFCKVNPWFNAILLRYFNPVGAHPSALIGESPINTPNSLVPVITATAIGNIPQLKVNGSDYPTRDGTCIRDYIHVSDIANAHVLAMKYLVDKKNTANCEVFNLGTGKGVSVMEAIKAFEKVSGLQLNYAMGPRREGDVVSIYSDSTKALEKLGWTCKFGVEQMMETAWNWEQQKKKLQLVK